VAYARATLTAEQALAGLESMVAAVAARRAPDQEVTVSP
jgi:hypothetical protein